MALMLPFRIFGEPTFADPFPLLKDLQYRPETGEGCNAKQCGEGVLFYIYRQNRTYNTCDKESPPALHSKIVLALYHKRVEHSYY